MKKLICILVGLTLCLAFFGFFSGKNQTPPEVAAEVYGSFLVAMKTGAYADVEPLIHEEFPEIREIARELFENIDDFEIHRWKRLNPDLWVVETNIIEHGEAVLCCHFLGKLQGSWYVMPNPEEVPSDLSRGADLSGYFREGALPLDIVTKERRFE